jgi:nicotinamidase-related amidase
VLQYAAQSNYILCSGVLSLVKAYRFRSKELNYLMGFVSTKFGNNLMLLINLRKSVAVLSAFAAIGMLPFGFRVAAATELELMVSRQLPVQDVAGRFHRIQTPAKWESKKVALILCDVWDSHHCVNAVRRVHEIAPRIDGLAKLLRDQGATIIHAPSDCMTFYENHAARLRAKAVAAAPNLPNDLNKWCDRIPSEESATYPIDQSDGGEDDDPIEHEQWVKTLVSEGRNAKRPWRQQIPTIDIDASRDFISDSGNEVWNILESKKIEHVVLCGVHTNMCVLGRPFGLRQLASHGKDVLLLRDLTDTMYNPLRWPYVSHFSGTDLIVDHIERYVCGTTTSDHLFRSAVTKVNPRFLTPHRFAGDRRQHLAILMAEDEYDTATTLPDFAAKSLQSSLRISMIFGDEADALLVSVRRRPLAPKDLAHIRRFVLAGKPIIGIRTASHAFCLRTGKPSEGLEQWPEFDAYALGGSYTNHYANDLFPLIRDAKDPSKSFVSKGSLYKVSPLRDGAHALWYGKVEGQPEEPVAWTFVRPDGGNSFYTSLGHRSDFEQPMFADYLTNTILRACKLDTKSSQELADHRVRYGQEKGKQR